METIRLEILSKDRVGMSHDLVEIFYRQGINIVGLEVFPNRMLIKFSKITERALKDLIEILLSLEEVDDVFPIHLLTHEENERKLTSAIESIPKGIITINRHYEIEIINERALRYLKLERDEVVGKSCVNFFNNDEQFLDLIEEGNSFENLKITLKEKNYLCSLKLITNDRAYHQGMILTFEAYSKAVQTASVVLNDYDSYFDHIIGVSKVMRDVKQTIRAVAPTPSTILLRGESGTGKELFAKALHDLSLRKDKPFIAINCASLPDSLIESELFGYEKGSFTGADRSHDGYFKQAHGGTLFLDEIGELSVAIQAKLLRVLQDSKVRRIGSKDEEKVDVRLIAATNKNLEVMINDGRFRADLYYRINVMPIFIPPLRDRLNDMSHLVQYFIQLFNNKLGKNVTTISEDYYNDLVSKNWPGNVRELQNYIERSMLLATSSILETPVQANLTKSFNKVDKRLQPNENESLKDLVSAFERQIIAAKLSDVKSIRQAAKDFKISHTGLNKKIKKYEL